jgi:hypothetical protein
MRLIAVTAVATLLAAGTSALASQPGPGDVTPLSSIELAQWRRGDAPPEPPRHWGDRGRDRWERHVDACLKRYRSYNPRTDMFYVRAGVQRRCRL